MLIKKKMWLSGGRIAIVLLFSYHTASFTLTPAALLNKKWMSGECLFTHLSMQHSIPLLTPNSFSPAQRSQKRQTPAVDLAHVLGLIRIVVPWRRGAARPARGACRHEACQRAFKEPGPRKGKQMAAGNYPTHALHLFPPASPSHPLLFNQCPKNPLGALKWKNVSMLGLSTQPHIATSLLTPVQHRHTFFFHKQQSAIHVYNLAQNISLTNKQEEKLQTWATTRTKKPWH